MRTALLLALALALAGVTFAAVPTAAACPDPDNPCDPLPFDPLDPPNIFCELEPGGGYGAVKRWAVCVLP